MRLLTALFICFFPLISFSQSYNYDELYLPKNEGKIVYSEVISADSKTKEEIYTKSKVWYANNFKSAEAVITFEDQTSGIISGNGNFIITVPILGRPTNYYCKFTVRIESRDSRYKYSIQDISIGGVSDPGTPIETLFSREWMIKKNGKPVQTSWDLFYGFEKEILALENSLKSLMQVKSSDDW